jgi:ABC-type branched-subunit amino acid transport system ATPase component
MAVLEVASVTKRFGGLAAVNEASFSVDAKSIHGLIGPNGSGKSTMFNLITGILRPDAGRIVIDGSDMTGAPCFRVIRSGVARTFQNIELFYDMSVLENCMVGTYSVTKAGAIAAALRPRWVRAEEARIRELAMQSLALVGLEDLAGELARNISYGHQRLLEIARALASSPKLVLLDEPAAGMNQAETRQLMGYIERIGASGVTVVLVEHNMKMVMNVCRRLTVLNYGEVIADGTPAEIQSNELVIAAYLGRPRS